MNSLWVFLVLFPAVFAVDCKNKPDGVYEKGCRAFVNCKGGVATITDCPDDKVFNTNSKICEEPSKIPAGDLCASLVNCTSKADGKYADTSQNCHTYYTCNGGTFFGHNFCPASLVFNEKLQACDWSKDTAPPCGSKKP